MVENQSTIFEMLYPTFKITKPIRLITLFSGYDSQALALKYLGVDFELYKTCEWAIKSIQALKDLHFGEDIKDYSKDLEISQIKEFLLNKGISSNYNQPMNESQINRLNEKQARTIYNNIKASHNLVNIQQVKGNDLEIVDSDKYTYIMTYSFPCQDLSLAGNRALMSDTSTRSGMLWEVERILTELEEKPQVLLMENVPQVHGEGAKEDFNKWQLRLEELGYKNYWKDLIATDYGIPQTRNRCFMVSILGDYNYTFPKPIKLEKKLKDMLEDNVDEKYFLSDAMKKYIFSENDKYKVNKNSMKIDREIACSKTTREGWTRADTSDYITIKNATKKGYLEATEGDEIDISSRMQHHRGNVQKDKAQTLTTQCDRGVVVNMKTELCNNLIKDGKVNKRSVEQNNLSPTLDTRCDCLGVCIGTYQYSKSDKFMHGKDRLQLGKEVSDTLQTTQKEGVVTIGNYSKSNHNASRVVDKEHCSPTVMENHGTITAIQTSNLRIRKLTPKECFRLMGVKDEDFEKVKVNQSDSSLYHLAGDSIVVNVLMAIFKEML